MSPPPPSTKRTDPLFPSTTRFRSQRLERRAHPGDETDVAHPVEQADPRGDEALDALVEREGVERSEGPQGLQPLLLAADGGAQHVVDVVEVAEHGAHRGARALGDVVGAGSEVARVVEREDGVDHSHAVAVPPEAAAVGRGGGVGGGGGGRGRRLTYLKYYGPTYGF